MFHNQRGRFSDVSEQMGVDLAMRGNGCVAADFNMDGWIDLYVTTARVNLLFWNNGDGTFSEGAENAGIDAYGWQTAAVAGDLNGDGLLDLFVAGYVDINNTIPEAAMGFPNTHFGLRDLLYVNRGLDEHGHAVFAEMGEVVGLESADFEYGLGALLSDLDGDGDLDLFVANDTNPNRLYENMPASNPPYFQLHEIGNPAHIDDTNSGMGVAGGDYNGDGQTDLFITNMGAQTHSLYQNLGAGTFQDGDVGLPDFGAGWTGWGTSWGDFDNDSDLDLLVVNGAIPVQDLATDGMLVNYFTNDASQLHDETATVGLVAVGALVGRGGAAADYDNDGDLDVAINSIGGALVLLQNGGTGQVATGNYLTINLGAGYIGAVVQVTLPDGRVLVQAGNAGSSYLSSEDPRFHFGLGTATFIPELQVQWLDGTETTLTNVRPNQILTLDP